ncbi:MAG TPA: hypothetical protein VN693_07145 [Rhodanobacteraceae bacterium]|nr:hypothetical protein [Rhodanobacteraceae bacterium]
MPRGDKSSYTDKQKRQAEDIERSEKARGRSSKTAERIAWATVNKQDGGGKKKSAATKKRATKKTTKKTAAKKSTKKGASGKQAYKSRA